MTPKISCHPQLVGSVSQLQATTYNSSTAGSYTASHSRFGGLIVRLMGPVDDDDISVLFPLSDASALVSLQAGSA